MTLNLPLDLLVSRFPRLDDDEREKLRRELGLVAAALADGSLELSLEENRLHFFAGDPTTFFGLMAAEAARTVLVEMMHAKGGKLHIPGCRCGILPPSRRARAQGSAEA